MELASQRRLALLFWASLCSLLSSVIVNTYASFRFLRALMALDEDGDGTKEVSDWLTQGNNNSIVAVITLMAMSRVEAMLLLALKLGPIDVGCPVPRRFYELINTELGMLTPIMEDLPSLVVTITASATLEEWSTLAKLNIAFNGLSMTFKLLGIAVDRMTAEEDVLSSHVVTENPLSEEAPTNAQEIAALRREVEALKAKNVSSVPEIEELKRK